MQIHYAAARGDINAVKAELAKGVDVDTRLEIPLIQMPELDDGELTEEIAVIASHMRSIFEEYSNNLSDAVGETPLIMAAKSARADTQTLQLLLDHGADPNARGGQVETCPLGATIQGSSLDHVRLLVKYGGDLSYVSSKGYNALIDVAYNYTESQSTILDYLLDHELNLDQATSYGENPAVVMSRRGQFELVKKLLDAGASREPLRWTDLMWSIVYDGAEKVATKLPSADLTALDACCRTPFLLACQVGDTARAKLLINHGASLQDTDHTGRHAMFFACSTDSVEMAQWLAEKSDGALLNKPDEYGTTPLMEASANGACKCVRFLLEAGVDINTQSSSTGRNAMSEAKDIRTVKVLMEYGGDIDVVDGSGYWLLKNAAETDSLAFTNELLAEGATVDVTHTGDTALHRAISLDHLDIAQALLTAGADPNATDVDGWNPLHGALSMPAISLLLNAGADPNVRDLIGQTPAETYTDPALREFISNRNTDSP